MAKKTGGAMMGLKEARELAELIRQQSVLAKGLRAYTAIVTLDDRITELEAQRDEVLEGFVNLVQTIVNYDHWIPMEEITLLEKITGKTWEKIKGEGWNWKKHIDWQIDTDWRPFVLVTQNQLQLSSTTE